MKMFGLLIFGALFVWLYILAHKASENNAIMEVMYKAKREADNIYKTYKSYEYIDAILTKRLKQKREVVNMVKNVEGSTEREYIHSMIGNIAGELLESGMFHVYRGVLNETGKELLAIFDMSMFILADKIGSAYINRSAATQQVVWIRRIISKAG
jgi:hypothetical protein